MSDWDVTDFGLEPRVADLEAVADAAGLDRFAMVGMSQGGPVGVAYAARHPGRLSRLILYGTYGRAMDHTDPQAAELEQTFRQMIKVGWARPDSTFRRVFTNLLIPGASDEQAGWLDDLQARATSTENAVQARAGRMDGRRPRPAAGTHRADARGARPRRPYDQLCAGPRAGRPDPGCPAGDAGQRQPHHAGRRAGLAGVRRRGGRLPGSGPGRRGNPGRGAALAHRPRDRRAAPGRAGPRQRGGRAGARAQRPDGRTPPDQHLRQARPHRPGRPGRRGRPAPGRRAEPTTAASARHRPPAPGARRGRRPAPIPAGRRVPNVDTDTDEGGRHEHHPRQGRDQPLHRPGGRRARHRGLPHGGRRRRAGPPDDDVPDQGGRAPRGARRGRRHRLRRLPAAARADGPLRAGRRPVPGLPDLRATPRRSTPAR